MDEKAAPDANPNNENPHDVLNLERLSGLVVLDDNTLKKTQTDIVNDVLCTNKSYPKNGSQKVNSEGDSLILTADDELESEIFLSDKTKTNEVKSGLGTISGVESDGKPLNDKENKSPGLLWVSNITHSVKAMELKQFISKVCRVSTAKIVSNGKDCYGYVVMENQQDANKCVKTLNNTNFEGRKITLSITKTMPKSEQEKHTTKLKTKSRRAIRTRNSPDPLTIKFDDKSRQQRWRSKISAREKLNNYRFRRRLLEEEWRNGNEIIREMRREERQRELEFRLDRERRKLQFEMELFERQRREIFRLDAERRKIERERLEVLQERSKLEQQLQKSRVKVKSSIFKPVQVTRKATDYSNFIKPKYSAPLVSRIRIKTTSRKVGKEGRNEDMKIYAPSENVKVVRKMEGPGTNRNVKSIEVMVRKYCADDSHKGVMESHIDECFDRQPSFRYYFQAPSTWPWKYPRSKQSPLRGLGNTQGQNSAIYVAQARPDYRLNVSNCHNSNFELLSHMTFSFYHFKSYAVHSHPSFSLRKRGSKKCEPYNKEWT
ncbi:hypothetical protein RI129_009737 [Pyrocoelia pectoralis]|uniref:RRM domain-containing protein n=1 Tax=Pyrocoelia pectoralis TaxID=417401 RepID=A0AAN7V2S0_9COLE